MKVISIKPAGVEPVYNMTVDKHHNYLIAGGLVLKNCDALRYFCQMRTLPAEMADEEEPEDWGRQKLTSYEDFMVGGEVDESYINY